MTPPVPKIYTKDLKSTGVIVAIAVNVDPDARDYFRGRRRRHNPTACPPRMRLHSRAA